jgi:hypothetical protein
MVATLALTEDTAVKSATRSSPVFPFVLALVLLASACCAQAQLVPCPGVDTVTGYKVLLDEIKFSSPGASPDDQRLMRLLGFHLRNRLETIDSDQGPGWILVRCRGRFPEDSNQFSQLTVSGLVNRDVVLEIWGEIARSTTTDVFINYALLPVPSASLTPFFQRRYRPKSITSPDDLMEWLSNINELSGYALVTRAVRVTALKGATGYDQAKRDLEKAGGMLAEAFGPAPDASQKRLLQFVRKKKCDLLQQARSDAAYSGVLKALPPERVASECAGVTP